MKQRFNQKLKSEVMTTIVTLFVGVFLNDAVGQQAGGDQPTGDQAMGGTPKGEVSKSQDARRMARRYLNQELPFHDGWNAKYNILVKIGTAQIEVPPEQGHEKYMLSRNLAYTSAKLDAMRQASNWLSNKLSTSMRESFTQNSGGIEKRKTGPAKKENPSLLNKARAYAEKKMDDLLREEGIDPQNPQGKKKIPRAEAIEKIKQVASSVSKSVITGMQAQKVFEGGGKIAVVGMISGKSDKAVQAFRDSIKGAELPEFKPRGIKMPQKPEDWLCQFGARVVIDNSGNLGVMSFGQAPVSFKDSIARRKAELNAKSFLRQFAGTCVMTSQEKETSQQTAYLEGDKKSVDVAQKYKDKTKSLSKEMTFSGIYSRGDRIVRHPLTNGKVAVVAMYWNVVSAQAANTLRSKMQDTKKNTGGGKSTGGTVTDKGGKTVDKDKKESITGESGGGVW